MFKIPDYTHNVSLQLSKVLGEIGVNEKLVGRRRRLWILKECVHTIKNQLDDDDSSVYYFGSQTEGTTTVGLMSDCDCLICPNDFNVIQNWEEWEYGATNLLVIQDETILPGYCLLQRLRDDAPLPHSHMLNEYYVTDNSGRMFLKNSVINDTAGDGAVRHGPALSEQGGPGIYSTDLVHALPCNSWPVQASHWLNRQSIGRWPSDEVKRYCSGTGCFVVPVGCSGTDREEFEWRISTSLTERQLMFSLNMTQIRCYVLMKMVIKTFISPQFDTKISSFMCKTVLFHCITKTCPETWTESNLISCLTKCLSELYECVLKENCPHFIIPENNLMAGRFSPENKHSILEILHNVVNSNGRALLQIKCDDLGFILQNEISNIFGRTKHTFLSRALSGMLLKEMGLHINSCVNELLSTVNGRKGQEVLQILSKYMFKMVSMYSFSQGLGKTALNLIAQRLCITLGSVLATLDSSFYNTLTLEAFTWLTLGLNSDVCSSKLKLASIFYCSGNLERAEGILTDILKSYNHSVVEPVCSCHSFTKYTRKRAFDRLSLHQNEEMIQSNTASCITFLPCEKKIIPYELQYEMFRSTTEELLCRRESDYWMNWVVIDSLTYLYFLQYKIYNHFRQHEKKQRALSNLVRTLEEEPNLGHRETALNLLGQCMVSENRHTDALWCYVASLNLREGNNAAKFHICRLSNTMINDL